MLTDHNSMDLKSSCFCNIMSIIQIAYNSNSLQYLVLTLAAI